MRPISAVNHLVVKKSRVVPLLGAASGMLRYVDDVPRSESVTFGVTPQNRNKKFVRVADACSKLKFGRVHQLRTLYRQ